MEGSGKLDSIVIATLPDAAVGCLTLGAQGIQVGDVIAMEAVDGLRFTPLAAPAGLEAQFQFTPVFSDGRSGDAVTVELYLLAEANGAPVAENPGVHHLQKCGGDCPVFRRRPRGDLLTYHILNKPARGAVTMPEDGSSEFVYTPYENKTGKDSFTYVAVDAVGNSSDPATVKIKIEKPNTKVTYADMDGDPAHKAAIRLAEEGIFVGECMGGAYFFQPDTAVTRGEFVAMAMNAAGMEALEDVERTGFADDVSIPTWAKPYVSSALKAGLVQGSRSSDGQVVFQAEEPITAAEAAVLLDRALQVTDVSADTLAEEGIPTWAAPVCRQSCHLRRTVAGRRPECPLYQGRGGRAAVRRAGVAGQPGWRLVLNSEQRMGRFRREPAHCLCAAHQKRETQGGRGAAQQDEKAPEKIPAGEVTSNIQASRECQKDRPAAMAREIEQDIAAAEEVDPPPPGIAAPIPKEGGDARQAQHGQKAHQAEVEGTLCVRTPSQKAA